jgi:phosphoenolpyruvate carboxykinase (GTP)
VTTPIGVIPTREALNLDGLDIDERDVAELLTVNDDEWRAEVPLIREHYAQFGDRLPAELHAQVDALEARLG